MATRTDDVDAVLSALADPTRRRVVELLGSGPRRAGDLAEQAQLSAPAMSRHLRVLLRANMVADQRGPDDARVRVFSLQPHAMVSLRAWLDQLQAHWDLQLRSFKEHVEMRRDQG